MSDTGPSALIAALPMYDLPELRAANDRLWAAIAERLRARRLPAPAELTRGQAPEDIWVAPNLLMAQTCGYPLVTSLAGRVGLVATPCYRAPGCLGSAYRSAVVVRAGDPAQDLSQLRGRRCAVNDLASNSGMNLLRTLIAPLADARAFFGEVLVTGAHTASVEAIVEDQADVAAIDCVTWAHLQRLRPTTVQALRVLCWTESHPGLPLITSLHSDARTRAALRRALDEAAGDPELEAARAELLLTGFETVPAAAYDILRQAEQTAAHWGYPTLR